MIHLYQWPDTVALIVGTINSEYKRFAENNHYDNENCEQYGIQYEWECIVEVMRVKYISEKVHDKRGGADG
ncbi:hypothetical protein, partial [uncultured Muribaculum sp.]|uniref:hypothetical protein n=1 Tax=uncultured Muribaculum sp. TaxID=1918613 RepID=UPI00265A652D